MVARNQEIIHGILSEQRHHLSATELWTICRTRGHRMSLATVYNSLHSLKQSGTVTEIQKAEGGSTYDAWQEPHAHMVCEDCGAVQDLEVSASFYKQLQQKLTRPQFLARRAEVTIHGRCSHCSTSHSGDGGAASKSRTAAKRGVSSRARRKKRI